MKITFSVTKRFIFFFVLMLLFLFRQLVSPHFNMTVSCFIEHLTVFITIIVNYAKREKKVIGMDANPSAMTQSK